MKSSVVLSCLAALVLTVSAARAHQFKLGDITIEHPWSRATPKGADVGAGYMVIRNTGTTADRLVGGTVKIANGLQVHEMSMEGTIMRMHQLKEGLEIPAGGSVAFKPGSFHLMFVGLSQPLVQGDMVSGDLRFEKAGTIHVEFMVGDMSGAMPQDAHDHGATHDHGEGTGHNMDHNMNHSH